MKILRKTKSFADSNTDQQNDILRTQNITSRDLLVEQMKQQRQLLQTQRLREKIQAQERRDSMRNLRMAQKDSEEEKIDDMKNQIKINKSQNDQNDIARNVGLYKTRSKPVQPVSMKN